MNKVEITQLDPVEHVLQNPDMYFGDIKVSTVSGFTYDESSDTIIRQRLPIANMLLKMVDELLMNATDNALRSASSRTKMTYIHATIDEERMMITVINDGLSIPIKKNDAGIYMPQLAFTNLFTSSNFTNDRNGAGKNGVGAAITSAMSTKFLIDVVCDEMSYKQVILDNCKRISSPRITEALDMRNQVRIVFVPDMQRILQIAGVENITDELCRDVFANTSMFIRKRIFDVNMSMSAYGITTYINDVQLPRISFRNYADKIIGEEADWTTVTGKNFELLIKQGGKTTVSFVNNIAVTGGVHLKKIFMQICEFVGKKLFKSKTVPTDMAKNIKSNISIFMKCSLKNPMFEGQSKSILQSADNLFDVILSKNDLDHIFNAIDFDDIVNGNKIKEMNKTIRVKKNKKLIIDKLSDATYAGTKLSQRCSLFICEGDSAAKFAKDGFAIVGHEYYGVFPLGGKPKNVNDTSPAVLAKNKVIMNIAKILGLPFRTEKQKDSDSLDLSQLRYGKVIMLKDADADGAHIMSLVMNFLHQLYPELLHIEGFFNEFITPMITITVPKKVGMKFVSMSSSISVPHASSPSFPRGSLSTPSQGTASTSSPDSQPIKLAGTIIETKQNIILPFYNTNDYTSFIETNPECKKYQPMYIKGLGGHNTANTNEYFRHFSDNIIGVVMDEKADASLKMAFSKKMSDARKQILSTRDCEKSLPRYVGQPISCTDFIENDWLNYSYEACERGIPSVVDGLKPSQRKVLYVLLNNCKPGISNSELNQDHFRKVFQLSGLVAQKGYYHHGDQSLNGTIIKMAQDFCGSNNLPLLAYSGSFGSRDMNGDDAGAPRYISATIHEVARLIFPQIDDELLTPKIEDNNFVEPIFYVPIIPMILVNGAKGIGTGYSTEILMHNPINMLATVRRIISIKEKCSGQNRVKADINTFFEPWYRHFKGDIIPEESGYCIVGEFAIKGSEVRVTEIPWTISKQTFIKQLQELYEKEVIADFRENKSASINDFDFTIIFNGAVDEEFVFTNLTTIFDRISTTNMTAFSPENTITKYENERSVFAAWFKVREDMYRRRKQAIEEGLRQKITEISEKAKFIKEVIDESIVLKQRPRKDIEDELKAKEYMNIDKLLSLPLSSITKEQYEKLLQELDATNHRYEVMLKTSIYRLWAIDLANLNKYLEANHFNE